MKDLMDIFRKTNNTESGEADSIDIRQFQTFKTVVDLNSFTKASHALQYSQATITAHIQQLEDEMGVPLFDRLGKKIQLTTFGRELYPYVEDLLLAYEKIKVVSTQDQSVKGELRLGASETMTIYKLGPILSRYKQRYPEVKISLINDDCTNLRARLHSGTLDLAIVLEPLVDDPQLHTEVYSEQKLVFIGQRDLDFNHIKEVNGECFVFSGKDCSLRRFFEAYLLKKGLQVADKWEFSSMEAIKQGVVNGLGISLMPYISVETLLEEEKIKVIETEDELTFYAQIAYHRNKWLSPAHRKFIELVLNHY